MSKRSINVYLQDILESIQKIEVYLEDVQEEEFYQNVEKQDSVLRRLEIIGEVVKNIPDDIRLKYDSIPWRKVAGLRDIIIHQYFGVTLSMVWVVVQSDLPLLKAKIKMIIADQS